MKLLLMSEDGTVLHVWTIAKEYSDLPDESLLKGTEHDFYLPDIIEGDDCLNFMMDFGNDIIKPILRHSTKGWIDGK